MTEIRKVSDIYNDHLSQLGMSKPDLLAREMDRAKRIKLYWNLYRGLHWTEDEQDDEEPTFVFNKTKVIINKLLSHLVGKPFVVGYHNDEVEKILAPYVKWIMKNSGGVGKFGYELAQMGFVTGDVALKVFYDSDLKSVRIGVVDSGEVFMRYTNEKSKAGFPDKVVQRYNILNNDVVVRVEEVYEKDRYSYYENGVRKNPGNGEQTDKAYTNLLGRPNFVHIRNQLLGKDVYGLSDIADLEPLNRLLNAHIRRFKDDVDYHGNPITLAYGFKLKNIEQGASKLWSGLPKEGRVENLELKTDLPAQQRMIEYLAQAIHEVGNVPEDSVNGKKHMSNVSGSALHLDQLPIVEITDRKRIVYGPGIEESISMALELLLLADQKHNLGTGIQEAVKSIEALYQKSDELDVKAKPWNEVYVKFQNYFEKDKMTQLSLLKQEIELGLESQRGAMKILGKENIDNKLLEVKAEQEAKRKLEQEAKDTKEIDGKVSSSNEVRNPTGTEKTSTPGGTNEKN